MHTQTKGFYKRTILILEQYKGDESLAPFISSILESPLKLAKQLISGFFNKPSEGLMSYRERIDATKRLALGLSSAEELAEKGDQLANYALYQFAFQQYFQSSIRARQGMVLDKALGKILMDNGFEIFPNTRHQDAFKTLGVRLKDRHDIDVFGLYGVDYLIIQIRSRDDTGGTTAKGSLVEVVEDISRTGSFPNKPIIYLIYVWEPLQRQQRKALINKIGAALGFSNKEKTILSKRKILFNGNNIQIGVVYGASELFDVIRSVFGVDMDVNKYTEIIDILSQWDDLWLSYAVATLELENFLIRRITNFETLDRLLENEGLEIKQTDLLNYLQSSANIAHKLALSWKENTIPFPAPSDQLNYIRDLLLLKMAHIVLKERPLLL